MKKLLPIAFILYGCCCFSQNAVIKGNVTDGKGNGLISANVIIDPAKGWATVTDFSGNYEIKMPAGSHLIAYQYKGKSELIEKLQLLEGDTAVVNVVLSKRGRKSSAQISLPDTNSRILKQLSEMKMEIQQLQKAIQVLLESNQHTKN